MWRIITVTIPEIAIEGHECLSDYFLTIQACEETKAFKYPFSNMKINVKEISSDDSMFITLSNSDQQVGHAQIALEPLLQSGKIEKNILLTQTEQSPEKNKQKTWQQKRVTVGKIKVLLKYGESKKKYEKVEVDHTKELENVREAFELMGKIVKNVWEIDEIEENSVGEIGVKMFDANEAARSLSYDDVQHFRIVLLGFNEKVKGIDLLQAKLKNAESFAKRVLKVNEELQMLVEVSKQNYEQLALNAEIRCENFGKDNARLASLLENAKAEIKSQEILIDTYKSKLLSNESQSALKLSQDSLSAYYNSMIAALKSSLSESESSRQTLISDYHKSLNEIDSLTSAFSSEISQLSVENAKLQNSFIHLTEKSNLQESIIEKQKSEMLQLLSTADFLQKQLGIYSETEGKLQKSQSKCALLSESLQDCRIEASKTLCNFNAFKSELSEEKENLLAHAEELQQENMKLQTSLIKQGKELSILSISHSDLILQMNTLEERLVLKEDRYDLHEELTYIQSFSSHLSQQVYRELDFMAEYLLGQSEHNLSNIRVMNRLKVMTEDKEAEINVLREMVTDLQRKRAVYIPIRDDVIDSAVADFVNTRTTELPFTREDHGVYVFGSKRVFVKLEQGRIISKDYLVRVGGGFMKIEDFLEVYTSQEIERIENRKKEDGNVQRNAILGKYAGNILSERTRGKIEVSPDKAVKWIKEAIGTPKFTQCVGVPKASPKKFTLSSRSPNRDKLRKIPSDDIEN